MKMRQHRIVTEGRSHTARCLPSYKERLKNKTPERRRVILPKDSKSPTEAEHAPLSVWYTAPAKVQYVKCPKVTYLSRGHWCHTST